MFEKFGGRATICCIVVGTDKETLKKCVREHFAVKSDSSKHLEFIRVWSTLVIKVKLNSKKLEGFAEFVDEILNVVKTKCSEHVEIIVKYAKSNIPIRVENTIRSILRFFIINEFDIYNNDDTESNCEVNVKKYQY